MAKHVSSWKTNKNLLIHTRNNASNSVKESKSRAGSRMPGYTDVSQHCLFTKQCGNLEWMIADLKTDQLEISKKLDTLEARRRTGLLKCRSSHEKHKLVFDGTSSSALSALDHTCIKRDSGLSERSQMLKRTKTSLVDDNRITNFENTKVVLTTRRLVHFSNVQHFKTKVSAIRQHGDYAAFEDVGMRTKQDKSQKREIQMRELRRVKTDMKEDNRIVSYEAQTEHVKDQNSLKNRLQANETSSMATTAADGLEILMKKANTMSSEQSRKGRKTTLTEQLEVKSSSMKGAVRSEPRSTFQHDAYHFDDSMLQSVNMRTAEQLTMALGSIGDDYPFLNMSALLNRHDLDSKALAAYQEGLKHTETGHSVETIICLDTSESMKGPSWRKAITFAKNFIQEVKSHPCGDPSVFERIGLVTFGQETCVQVHLTRHYHEILKKLDTLSPSGPTPMTPGLQMCVAAIEGGGKGTLTMNKMRIHPRIILITDGETTSHSLQSGPDFSFTQKLDEDVVMFTVQEIVKSCNTHIDCVPLGESKVDFLTMISQATGGKMYKCEDWRKLGRRTHYLHIACRLYQDFLRKDNSNSLREIMTLSGIKGEDVDIVKETMRRAKEDEKGKQLSEENIKRLEDQLLLIGTRVRKGPDWEWRDQDSDGIGTVVGYDKNSWVNVVWDNFDSRGRNSNMYRYSVGGHFDVVPVDEPRVLSPGERIAVGCKVKRGKDWKHGDEDGGSGSVGTVIKTSDRSDKVAVRWPNRKTCKYKFGKEGINEIELCDMDKKHISVMIQEKEIESEKEKPFKELEHQNLEQNYDKYVEEMNRRNIEISKMYIVLPGHSSGARESSNFKPNDSKVKMDADVTAQRHKVIKRSKNK